MRAELSALIKGISICSCFAIFSRPCNRRSSNLPIVICKILATSGFENRYRSFKKRTMGIANIKLIHGSRKVHAKYLGVDLREGMFGSHNLFWPLALIGTKEIMIYCTNKALIRQIETWVSGEILQ